MLTNELKEVATSLDWQLNWSSNWEKCMEIALTIFQGLPKSFCRQLAHAYVEEYMPVFRQRHPEAQWVWEYLAIISASYQDVLEESIGEFMLPESGSEFSTPGSNGFVKALEELWELTETKQAPDTSEKALSVIVEIIMCKLDERWGGQNPEKWEQWYRSLRYEDKEELDTSQRTSFVKSSSICGLVAMEWVSLANRLEIIIQVDPK